MKEITDLDLMNAALEHVKAAPHIGRIDSRISTAGEVTVSRNDISFCGFSFIPTSTQHILFSEAIERRRRELALQALKGWGVSSAEGVPGTEYVYDGGMG